MQMPWLVLALSAMSTAAMATQDVQVEAARLSGNSPVDILAAGASKAITYRDSKGVPISKQTFLDAIRHGGRFIYERDEAHAATAFMLTPHDAKLNTEAAVAFNNSWRGKYKVRRGQSFPDFTLATVNGGSISPASLRGQPTVMQFFFAKCITCFVDNPALNAFARSHPDVRVLALTSDDARAAGAYARQHDLAWPVAYAGQKVFDALGVKVFPTLALVSADGRLLDLREGGKIAGRDGNVSGQDLDRWVHEGLSSQDDGQGRVSETAGPTMTTTPAD